MRRSTRARDTLSLSGAMRCGYAERARRLRGRRGVPAAARLRFVLRIVFGRRSQPAGATTRRSVRQRRCGSAEEQSSHTPYARAHKRQHHTAQRLVEAERAPLARVKFNRANSRREQIQERYICKRCVPPPWPPAEQCAVRTPGRWKGLVLAESVSWLNSPILLATSVIPRGGPKR